MYKTYREHSAMGPVVHLSDSCSLRGFTKQFQDSPRPLHLFLGVPFAEPPIGEQRFKLPQELKLWSGERTALKSGPFCPQHYEIMTEGSNFPLPDDVENSSEDCLYLNVWTSNLRPDKPLPVMVYIHGGGFALGYTGDETEGVDLCAEHDVIYVAIHYRLNLFGFFTTCDDVMPGNLGLWDQIEALKWVQKHIGRFGGDPNNVTVLGESAGAISVSHLMLTAQTRGLFHRAICQSGHSLAMDFMQNKEIITQRMRAVLDKLGCSSTDSGEIRDFLLGLDSQQVLAGTQMFEAVPWIDGKLFTDKPTALLRNPPNGVDVMIGKTSDEGTMYIAYLTSQGGEPNQDMLEEAFMMIVAEAFSDQGDVEGMMRDLLPRYISKPDMSKDEVLTAISSFGGDSFLNGTNKVIRRFGERQTTYVYHLTHRPSFTSHTDMPWVGADHGDDLFYLFGSRWTTVSLTEEERMLGRRMRAYWASFATSGVPSCPDCPEWKASTTDSPCYLELCVKPQLKSGLIDADAEQAWEAAIDKHVTAKHPLSEK